MTDIYLYADETGNLDHAGIGKHGASDYFGFGTAFYVHEHGKELWSAQRLRVECETAGLNLPRGFHATADSRLTRDQVFREIAVQSPRFDATFLRKAAYPSVRRQCEMYLYRLAWSLHLKLVAPLVGADGNRLVVVVGTFGTAARKREAMTAVQEVCSQLGTGVQVCVWDSSTAWGLQVADYALWAIHRHLLGRPCPWYESSVEPTVGLLSRPWG